MEFNEQPIIRQGAYWSRDLNLNSEISRNIYTLRSLFHRLVRLVGVFLFNFYLRLDARPPKIVVNLYLCTCK